MKAFFALSLATILIPSLQAQVLPNDAIVDGKTISEWSAEFWQWVIPIPTNNNPYLALDGSNAHVNQPDGPVFFVAAVFKISNRVRREFTVPEGKHLFFPLITVYVYGGASVEQMRDNVAAGINLVTNLHASIDGVPLPDLWSHRVASTVFGVNLDSSDNLFSYNNGAPIAGLFDPMVSDGYWLMIEPLSPGTHEIVFGGAVGPPVNFSRDVTNIVTVVAIPITERVEQLWANLESVGLSPNQVQPLRVSLEAAQASFARDNYQAGANQLRAFQNKVRAQVLPLDQDLAGRLVESAQFIIRRSEENLN